MRRKYRINVSDKEAYLSRYEVIIKTAEGNTIKHQIDAYSYARVFESLCEMYENDSSLKVESINIRAIDI